MTAQLPSERQKVPAISIENCPNCAKSAHAYDMACRACYLRWLTRLPEVQRKGQYAIVSARDGEPAAKQLVLDVAAHYKNRFCFGSAARK